MTARIIDGKSIAKELRESLAPRVAALKEQGKDGKILVYGVDGSPDGKGMIAEGIMTATSAQFPRKIGRMAADVIYRFFDGEEIPKRVLVQTELVTIENLEEYGTDGWQ